jgi:hypothetical protein
MKRYFFDLVKHVRSELDYVGRVFATPEEAYDAAQLIAFDLVVTQMEEMVGSAITVSSAKGRRLFSIPVRVSCLAATPLVV